MEYSCRIFLGGTSSISVNDIKAAFCAFDVRDVHFCAKKHDCCFITLSDASSTDRLVRQCRETNGGGEYLTWPITVDKKICNIQVIPWRLEDARLSEGEMEPRRTVFVGGLPMPTTAKQLAAFMAQEYGPVRNAAIKVCKAMKYPVGCGYVEFFSFKDYIDAVVAQSSLMPHNGKEKIVDLRPYVAEALCDECQRVLTKLFCGDIVCLQYYCRYCWWVAHSTPGREEHTPTHIGFKRHHWHIGT